MAVKEYEVCVSTTPELNPESSDCRKTTLTDMPLSNLPVNEGAWYWKVRAYDQHRAGSFSAVQKMVIDETDPTASLAPQTGLLVGGTQPIFAATIKVADDNLRFYEVSITDINGASVFFQRYDVTDVAHEAVFEWDASEQKSGTYNINVMAHDASGRIGQIGVKVTVDNDGPLASVRGGNIIINSGSLAPRVVLENKDDVASFSWAADALNATSVFNPELLQPFFTPSTEGTYTYYLTLLDALGNITTFTFTFDYDEVLEPIVAPIAPIDKTPNPGTVTPVTRIATVAPDLQKRSSGEEANANSVLGTTAAAATAPPVDVAPVASTQSGWSILGILWYWWLVVIALLGIIALFVRRYLQKRQVALNS